MGPLSRADDCFHGNEFLSYGPTIPLMTIFTFLFVHRTECQPLTRMVSALRLHASHCPSEGYRTKHARLLDSAILDDFDKLIEHLSISPLILGAPSTVSKPSEFIKSQAKEGRILNDRPDKDENVPPIDLLYAPFGRFLDHIRNRPEEQPGVDLREFQFAVDNFASVMCRHFKDEDVRRDEVLPLLNTIFRCYHPFTLPPLQAAVIIGNKASDGHANGPTEFMETVVAFKNEFGSGQTDPEIQTTSYYLQMFNEERKKGFKNIFPKYLCPSLAISIIGIKARFRHVACSHILLFRFVCRVWCPCPS